MPLSSLEIRIIGYGIAALLLIGGSVWGGHKLTSIHYEALMQKQELQRQTELLAAQQRVIDAQMAQKNAEDSERADHEKLVQANELLSSSIHDSVHDIGDTLSNAVSAAMANSQGIPGAGTGTGGDPELAASFSRVGSAVEATTKAGLHDSAELTGILEQYAKITQH